MKSHKGTQKRIGVTGSGKAIRVKSWRGHHLELKSSRRTRRYAGKATVSREFVPFRPSADLSSRLWRWWAVTPLLTRAIEDQTPRYGSSRRI